MKKNLRKLSALLLALVMVLGMSAAAFAADDTENDTYSGSAFSGSETNPGSPAWLGEGATSIPLKKSVIFFNENSSAVYEPNITYTYTVEGFDPGNNVTITDDPAVTKFDKDSTKSVTVNVLEGPADGVTGGNIVFASTNDAVTTTNTNKGVEVQKNLNMSLDISKFTHAGVYRYKITETQNPADVKTVGLQERGSDYTDVRYLDVYIANKADGTGLEMHGAVIFKTVKTGTDAGKDSIDKTFVKTTGFEPKEPDANTGYKEDGTVDRYWTYDFTVKKEVTGGMADKTHEFPFYVTVANTINGAAYTYIADNGEKPATATQDVITATKFTAGATTQTVGTNATSSALTLKNGDQIKFVGVPSNQTTELTLMVKEFNDSVDQYTATVKATVGKTANTAVTTDPANGIMAPSTGTAALAAAFAVKTNDVANQLMTVTNNLSEISPTGVVLRIAPYMAILCGGIVLLVLTKKRKADEEA